MVRKISGGQGDDQSGSDSRRDDTARCAQRAETPAIDESGKLHQFDLSRVSAGVRGHCPRTSRGLRMESNTIENNGLCIVDAGMPLALSWIMKRYSAALIAALFASKLAIANDLKDLYELALSRDASLQAAGFQRDAAVEVRPQKRGHRLGRAIRQI